MSDLSSIQIQSLNSALWKNVAVDVLRLDQLHPVVSGNKWFKLRYYLEAAQQAGKQALATYGGAYSNHLVATAFACKHAGLRSVGIVRGEKPPQLSASLREAASYGMELVYVSRGEYRFKDRLQSRYANENWYWVNEGGFGKPGMKGAAGIMEVADTSSYSHIVTSCGTGTTLAGLVAAAGNGQRCIGISALKGHTNLERDVMQLTGSRHQEQGFEVFHDYHFGGYAKHPQPLLDWMNMLWREEQLPTDIVYTAKLLFAVRDLAEKGYFSTADKVLVIHSGGLQGNRSLAPGRLEFS